MYGIVQGGIEPDLRERSARALAAMKLPGYSVGGLAVGEPQEKMLEILDLTVPLLPADKPHYLMGVGTPEDIILSVERGIDQFGAAGLGAVGRCGGIGVVSVRATAGGQHQCQSNDERMTCPLFTPHDVPPSPCHGMPTWAERGLCVADVVR